MGCRIVALASESRTWKVSGALEAQGHPAVGRDAGLLAGCGELKIAVTSDIPKGIAGAQVLIDFSSPSATPYHAAAAAERGIALVVGTTGLTRAAEDALSDAAKRIPVIAAPNMSVGVNLLFRIAPLIASALDEAYDIEIVEAHHNRKKDAPSGTALRLLELLQSARGGAARAQAVHGRHGADAVRRPGEIGMHAVRAGDIVGEHTVTFATQGERIEITHRASSRDTFALGALRAASFLVGRPPRRYGMDDVLFGGTAPGDPVPSARGKA